MAGQIERSLQLTEAGITAANKALDKLAITKSDLATRISVSRSKVKGASPKTTVGMSRTTIHKFFKGEPVQYREFKEICKALELDWQEVSGRSKQAQAESSQDTQESNADIDALVQQVRSLCQDKIHTLDGKMPLVDGNFVNLDDLFVYVEILTRIPSKQSLPISVRQQNFDPTAEDLTISSIRDVAQKRILGLKAAESYPRLMVLGEPGAGKTTFLQYLAVECDKGKFKADHVPIFLELKKFATYGRDVGNFDLLNYICQILPNEITQQDIKILIEQGRALILLDGLDEVSEQDARTLKERISYFSDKYFKNRFVISCRSEANKYRFTNFTDIKIADFDIAQIKLFSEKWFLAITEAESGKILASAFMKKLEANQRMLALSVTPLLLNLLCLFFYVNYEYQQDFPANKAKLYERCVEILLRELDEKKGIYLDEFYHKLSVHNRNNLLSQVAVQTFKDNKYFFKISKLQELIAEYICKLPGMKAEREDLLEESRTILQSIEVRNGLLRRGSEEFYSFSHLTFHEYFTAKNFVNSSDPDALKNLAGYITERRWREVFYMATGIMEPADELLRLIKKQVDALVVSCEKVSRAKLLSFLAWINDKSSSIPKRYQYKPAMLRAFYLALTLTSDSGNNLGLARVLGLKNNFDSEQELSLDRYLSRTLVLAPNLHNNFDLADKLLSDLREARDRARDGFSPRSRALGREPLFNPKLQESLQQLKDELPNPREDREKFKEWWITNGQAWIDLLREVTIEYRNFGHDWQFREHHKEALEQYLNTNKLLISCMNSGCEVTPEVREEIEETLLLPIAEIEKRKQLNR